MHTESKASQWLHRMKFIHTLVWIAAGFCFLLLPADGCRAEETANFNNLPVKGMVTMIDLGAKKCVPCKMMAPILVKMEEKYHGKASIVFIDVWKHSEQAERFEIRAIPTQIFFDAAGKEVYRHVGFMGEEEIVQAMEKLGVKI